MTEDAQERKEFCERCLNEYLIKYYEIQKQIDDSSICNFKKIKDLNKKKDSVIFDINYYKNAIKEYDEAIQENINKEIQEYKKELKKQRDISPLSYYPPTSEFSRWESPDNPPTEDCECVFTTNDSKNRIIKGCYKKEKNAFYYYYGEDTNSCLSIHKYLRLPKVPE